MKESDLDLENLNNFLNGDEAGFSYLYKKYEKILLGINHKYHRAETEDCIQITFLKIYQKRVIFKPGRTVYNYILSTYRTTRIDMWRKNNKKKLEAKSCYPSMVLENLERSEEAEMLLDRVNSLPDKIRDAIDGLYFKHLTQAETAKKFTTTQASICTRHKKGLAMLKEVYNGRN